MNLWKTLPLNSILRVFKPFFEKYFRKSNQNDLISKNFSQSQSTASLLYWVDKKLSFHGQADTFQGHVTLGSEGMVRMIFIPQPETGILLGVADTWLTSLRSVSYLSGNHLPLAHSRYSLTGWALPRLSVKYLPGFAWHFLSSPLHWLKFLQTFLSTTRNSYAFQFSSCLMKNSMKSIFRPSHHSTSKDVSQIGEKIVEKVGQKFGFWFG